MAYTGQTIINPVSGERITFLQTSADTDGELLEFELELTPDGHVPGAHVHPAQEERFHVLSGRMKFRRGLRRVAVELAMEGNVTRSGMPRPLHLALFVQRFRREVRAPFPPAWVVTALMSPLRAIARARGLGERYATA